MSKLKMRKYAVKKQKIQASNIKTDHKVKFILYLPQSRSTKIATWECHVDDFTEIRHATILGRDIITSLVLSLECSKHVIKGGDGTFRRYITTMVDMSTYDFENLNTEKY